MGGIIVGCWSYSCMALHAGVVLSMAVHCILLPKNSSSEPVHLNALDLGIKKCAMQDWMVTTWLQFAFPAYLFLLMGGIIVGCRTHVPIYTPHCQYLVVIAGS